MSSGPHPPSPELCSQDRESPSACPRGPIAPFRPGRAPSLDVFHARRELGRNEPGLLAPLSVPYNLHQIIL